jgi:TolA-binding protein
MSFEFLARVLRNKTLHCVFTLVLTVGVGYVRAASTAPEPSASSATGGAFAATLPAAQVIPPTSEGPIPPTKITRKQRQDILKSKFEKMKEDAEQLSSLANSLQDELNKSSENILSLPIVEKAEKIEKLAKRIKNAAKGD